MGLPPFMDGGREQHMLGTGQWVTSSQPSSEPTDVAPKEPSEMEDHDLASAIRRANTAADANTDAESKARAAQQEFDEWEQSQAEELAGTVADAVSRLRSQVVPRRLLIAKTRLGFPRYVQGWEEPDTRAVFKLGAEGEVYSGSMGLPGSKGFALNRYTPHAWSLDQVAASRQRDHWNRDSHTPDSAYVRAFEMAELALVSAVYAEVRTKRHVAVTRLGEFLSNVGVRP